MWLACIACSVFISLCSPKLLLCTPWSHFEVNKIKAFFTSWTSFCMVNVKHPTMQFNTHRQTLSIQENLNFRYLLDIFKECLKWDRCFKKNFLVFYVDIFFSFKLNNPLLSHSMKKHWNYIVAFVLILWKINVTKNHL